MVDKLGSTISTQNDLKQKHSLAVIMVREHISEIYQLTPLPVLSVCTKENKKRFSVKFVSTGNHLPLQGPTKTCQRKTLNLICCPSKPWQVLKFHYVKQII